jgi:hypothetical protein
MGDISNARKILRQLTRRVVSFFPAFAEISDSAKAGLFLSQAFFWTEDTHNDRDEGWFYKTSKEWTKETFLTRHEQDTCRDILVEKGFLLQEVKGFPPKCHFKVQFDEVLKAVSNLPESGKLIAEKRQSDLPESGNVSSIEITTKSTDEIAPSAPLTACEICGARKDLCVGHTKGKKKAKQWPNRNGRREEYRVEEERSGSKGEKRAAKFREAAENFRKGVGISPGIRELLSAGPSERVSDRNVRAWLATPKP